MLTEKYRPKHFSDVIGQKHIISNLSNSVKNNSIHTCYLFAGTQGLGKTTVARIFSRILNCTSEDKPCGECNGCLSAEVNEIDAASNRGIDNARQLRELVKFIPRSRYRSIIFDEAHSLTKDAANCLLKTLEEPTSNTIFIFCTTQPTKIIHTIQSRAQKFYFKRVFGDELFEFLAKICKKEKIKISDSVLWAVCGKSKGIVRDALTYLELVNNAEGNEEEVLDNIGAVAFSEIRQLFDILLIGNLNALCHFIEQIHQIQVEYNEMYETLMRTIFSSILKNSGVESKNIYTVDSLDSLSIPLLFNLLTVVRDEYRNSQYENSMEEINFNIACMKMKNIINNSKKR